MKSTPIVAAALLALSLTTSGCGSPSAAETGDDDRGSAALERVTAAPAQRKTLTRYTTQPGRIEAYEQTPLFPKVTGFIKEVLVDIGDPVTEGQPLLMLSIPEMEDEVAQKDALRAQAAAEVEQAAAAVVAAEAAVETAAARVTQAQAGIGRAEADRDFYREQFNRMENLASSGSVEPRLVDEARNQFRAAAAAVDEAHAGVAAAQAAHAEAQANVRKAQADEAAAQARVQVADADLQYARTMLAYGEIKAPYDGVVTARNVDTGHYVHPASGGAGQPLLVVARTDMVRIFVDVPELEAALVDAGDPAIVRVQALAGREFEATVTRTGWSLDTSNRSLRTEIDIPNTDGLLRPGMYAIAVIRLDERPDVLTLPTSAIVQDGSGACCWCVTSGHTVRTPIEVGLRVGDEVEVLSGLDSSQVVALTKADSLQEGQQVEVLEP